MEELRERMGAALAVLTAWNNDFFGLGGAAGDMDEEQEAALEQVTRTLENIAVEHGLFDCYEGKED